MAASYMHCNNHVFWHADLTRTYMPPKKVRKAARLHGIRNGMAEREIKKVDSGYLGKGEDDEISIADDRTLVNVRLGERTKSEMAPSLYAESTISSIEALPMFVSAPSDLSLNYGARDKDVDAGRTPTVKKFWKRMK
jgi:hypothetical protein